jgi:hypothetical protein
MARWPLLAVLSCARRWVNDEGIVIFLLFWGRKKKSRTAAGSQGALARGSLYTINVYVPTEKQKNFKMDP